jgi:hypothetical protein
MSDFSIFIFLFEKKITLKSHLIKSNHRFLRNYEVDTYGAPALDLMIVPLFKVSFTHPISEADFALRCAVLLKQYISPLFFKLASLMQNRTYM